MICVLCFVQCRGKGGRSVGFRRCAVTLPGAGDAATLRRCDAPGGGWRCDAATLRRCRWASDAATLRRCDAAVGPVTLRRCWRCDAATLRRCDAVGAATLRRGSDAATLLALRRFLLQECTRRCVAARHGNPH